MAKVNRERTRSYSRYTVSAVGLLAKHIRGTRISEKLSEKIMSERLSISRATYQKIEKGDMRVEIGLYFESATILSIKLFEIDVNDDLTMAQELRLAKDRLILLPKRVRKKEIELKDDF